MEKSDNIEKKRSYNSIDLFKFIMAIFVVAIHTHPFENCNNAFITTLYDVFIKCVVPFFFIASGFVLSSKFNNNLSSDKISILKKQMFKIIKLYIMWNIIYLPLAIYDYVTSGHSLVYCLFHYIRGMFFIGEHYNSWILWYLLSTIYSLAVLIFCYKKKLSNNMIIVIAIVVLLISYGLDYLSGFEGQLPYALNIIKKVTYYTISNGRILTGLFYISFGIYIYGKKNNNILNILILCISFILSFVLSDYFVGKLFIPLYSTSLFILIQSLTFKDSKIWFGLRKMSTTIYFIHLYIWTLYYYVIYGKKHYGLDSFIYTTLICLIVSLIYNFIASKKKYNYQGGNHE